MTYSCFACFQTTARVYTVDDYLVCRACRDFLLQGHATHVVQVAAVPAAEDEANPAYAAA